MKSSKESAKAAGVRLNDVYIIYIIYIICIPNRLPYAPSTGINDNYRLFFPFLSLFWWTWWGLERNTNSFGGESEYTLL